MHVSFKMLKTQQIEQREITENMTLEELIAIAKEAFSIKEEGIIKLIVGNTILSNYKPIAQQKVCEGAVIIVNFRAARKVEMGQMQVPDVAPQEAVKSDATAQKAGDEWYPTTYLDYINNKQQTTQDQSPADPFAQLDRYTFPFKYFLPQNMAIAQRFAQDLAKDPSKLLQLTQDAEKQEQFAAFLGSREFEQNDAEQLLYLVQKSAEVFNASAQDEEDKAFEEQQMYMLRQMGELNDYFDELPNVDDVYVTAINYQELRQKFQSQLQTIKEMGVGLSDEEILQMLELAGGNAELVINQIFGM